MAYFADITDLIGNTPLVEISELSPNPRVRILVKLEGQNPGGSVKDRAAKWMIDDAEKNGTLKPARAGAGEGRGTSVSLISPCPCRSAGRDASASPPSGA